MNEQQTSAYVPHYARPSLGMRIGLAWAAIVCSSAVIGAGLGMFEMQARSASAALQATPTLSAGTPGGVQAGGMSRNGRRG